MKHILSLMIFLPSLAALALFLVPKNKARLYVLGINLLSFFIALLVWQNFDDTTALMQFSVNQEWIPQFGISYALGLDGISLPLVALTAFIAPIALLGTWPSNEEIPKNEKFFLANILFLQTGMYGTFLAQDLFLFYFFWEIVLIPMFFMIGIWGGEKRIYATLKFFLYTLVGSLLMLVAIFWLGNETHHQLGHITMAFDDIKALSIPFNETSPWSSPATWLFLAFALAFAIKVPMVPFHTWLPDAHVQAPTIGSVFLAAVLLKMGTYGFIRLAIPFFPQAAFWAAPVFQALGVVGIIYGALCAMAQDDFKKLVAYSSVSHMGYILVGLFSFNHTALAGSLYQMINHGISSAGLFLIVGFLYQRLHTRNLNDFGSLAKIVPLMAISFMIMTLSSVALPGTNGFVGEFTILLGAFQTTPVMSILSGVGVVLGAVYALGAYQKVMLGPKSTDSHHDAHGLLDLNKKELISMILLTVFVFVVGFFPNTFFGKSETSISALYQFIMSKIIL